MATGYWKWKSDRLEGKEMQVIRYGHVGPPMIVFPTHTASAWQFQDYGMPEDCGRFMAEQRIQFFAIDGYNGESWCNAAITPRERILRHLAYEAYVMEELLPLVREVAQNDRIGCMGCSFGAYHALNMGRKFPDVFKVAMAFMGVYDLRGETDGYTDEDFFSCNPPDFVARVDDALREKYRTIARLVLVGGEDDAFHHSTVQIHEAMVKHGVDHWFEDWKSPANHHEYWWKQQLPDLIEKLY